MSFLYNIDLENIICKYSLKSVKIILKFLISDEEYKEISKVLDANKLCYFDDILTILLLSFFIGVWSNTNSILILIKILFI